MEYTLEAQLIRDPLIICIGEFVDIMKKCTKSKDYTEIDNAIEEKVAPFLYNDGGGKYVPTSEIIHVRNCIRTGQKVCPPSSQTRNGEPATKLIG